MKPIDLMLRGYAEKLPDNSWYAICIDLNLYTQADNKEEAIRKLHNMIKEYVREALEDDSEYFRDLMPRKAPLYFIVKYYWISLLIKLDKASKNTKMLFTDHLPLVVHG